MFHRACLRSLLGVKGHLRNEIVYVLAHQFPLDLYVAKVLLRYRASLGGARLVSKVSTWVDRIDNPTVSRGLTLNFIREFHHHQLSVPSVYQLVYRGILRGLKSAERLKGRPVLAVWCDFAMFALSGKDLHVDLPVGWTL